MTDKRLGRAIDYIEANLGNDLRVKDIASLIALDPRSLTRTFRKETGYTPFAFITKQRMVKAQSLLRRRDMTVTDVAVTVGYANPAKFASAFRRCVGTSPSQWRIENCSMGKSTGVALEGTRNSATGN